MGSIRSIKITEILYILFASPQVGACIVNNERKIVGIGYNGMPNGCSDDVVPWSRTADNKLDTKYPYGKSSGEGLLA